jgi:hypothetical protein
MFQERPLAFLCANSAGQIKLATGDEPKDSADTRYHQPHNDAEDAYYKREGQGYDQRNGRFRAKHSIEHKQDEKHQEGSSSNPQGPLADGPKGKSH